MKRKVIKQGNGTLTITLPKGWTEEIGLEGGDEVEIEADGLKLGDIEADNDADGLKLGEKEAEGLMA